jgi:type I restriction enzyme, S subunit
MTAMEEWKAGKLGGLCSIEIGGTPSRSNPDYWDSAKETTNRWVSIRDLNKRVVSDTAEHITNFGARHSNVKLQKTGTVLLSFKLSIGRVAFAGCDLYTNEAIAGLCSEELDSNFLFYGLQQWDLLQNVDQAIKGATLNKEKLKLIEFEYPADKEEQTQIATILSTLDQAIEQTEAIIAKHQRIKAGLMQDLLTKGIDENGAIRSEVTHQFKDSPLGRIPVEWEVVSVEDLCSNIVDCPHTTPTYEPSGVPCIRTADMIPGQLLLDQAYCITENDYRERVARLIPKKGDVIYSREGERLGIASPVGNKRVCLGQRVMLLRPGCETDPDYLLWAMNSPPFYNRIVTGLGATTSPHINVGDIRKALILKPAPEEQGKIGKMLAAQSLHFRSVTEQTVKYRKMKAGLMHDLLTGTVRVN